MRFSIPKYNPGQRRRTVVAAIFGMLIFGTPMIDVWATSGKIYPGVHIASIAVGGQSIIQARAELDHHIETLLTGNATFTLSETTAEISLRSLVTFDTEALIAQAQKIGNTGSPVARASQRFHARTRGIEIMPNAIVARETLYNALLSAFGNTQTKPSNASFSITKEEGAPKVRIVPETMGTVIDIEDTQARVWAQASALTTPSVTLSLKQLDAPITQADLEQFIPQVEALVSGPATKVRLGQSEWTIAPETLVDWIEVVRHDQDNLLTLNSAQITAWLNSIAEEVERAPVNAIFELSEDQKKVTRFDIGTSGVALPRSENVTLIGNALLSGKTPELITRPLPPAQTTSAGADFGIKELVGRGTTNFKGSPVNRVKNIKRGAAILQGMLIAPGEEFSLLEHLRPFTLENGYLPELVIKAAEGKTVPEIGGGLCQIGTTMFRTVLDAGLPVTARRNHSYRVSYYEPPVGMDATIYDPAPDFQFLNDTGAWLILTTKIEGTTLTFELWGTKDGRIAETTEPEVFNLKQPPEKKIIETTDLPVGQTKCTERAHIGSDAKFTYTVRYTDGRVEEKEFFSRYRPWQEVCLIGVEKLTVPEEAPAESLPISPDTAAPIIVQN